MVLDGGTALSAASIFPVCNRYNHYDVNVEDGLDNKNVEDDNGEDVG